MDDRRRDQVERLHGLLTESVEAIQSSDDWKRMLDFAGRFHRYSFDNQLLIAAQHDRAFRAGWVEASEPSFVAGFRTWKALGRSVSKGQRGYGIFAPMASHARLASAVAAASREHSPGESEQPARGPLLLHGFTVAHVWDVSQTSGTPIPESSHPELLRGKAPDGLYEQLTALLNGRGFAVSPAVDAAVLGGANGLADFRARTVQVRSDMDAAARVKTLAHETGHVLLHDPSVDTAIDAAASGPVVVHRGRAEVEAESVAYILTAACGMDPASYSLPYVATWAGTRAPAEAVRATARRVIGAAQQVLGSIQVEYSTGGVPPGLAHAPQHTEMRAARHGITVADPAPLGLGR
jgi:antirestriction protein ArdC